MVLQANMRGRWHTNWLNVVCGYMHLWVCVCVRVRLRHTPGYSLLWFYLERETHTQGVDMALGSTDRSCIPAKVNTHTHTKKGVKPLPFQLAASLGLWLNSFWGFHLSEQAEAQRKQYSDEQEGVAKVWWAGAGERKHSSFLFLFFF